MQCTQYTFINKAVSTTNVMSPGQQATACTRQAVLFLSCSPSTLPTS